MHRRVATYLWITGVRSHLHEPRLRHHHHLKLCGQETSVRSQPGDFLGKNILLQAGEKIMLSLDCIQFYWMEEDPNEIHPLMHTSEIAFRVRRTRLMREYEAAICRRWKEGWRCHAMPSSFLPSLYLLGCDKP